MEEEDVAEELTSTYTWYYLMPPPYKLTI
jgi:hypothetical protein